MKVLRVVSELNFGGVEKVILNSIPFLSQDNSIEVRVLVLGKGGIVEERLRERGAKVHVLKKNNRIPNVFLLSFLINYMNKEKPDVVHTQGAEANFHGLIAARIARIPLRIGEEIGFPNHHSYWKFIFKFVYKNATKVIAISQAVKDRIVELGEVLEEKVEVVYNPVSLGERLKGKGRTKREENVRGTPDSYRDSRGQDVGAEINYSDEKEKLFVFVTTCRLVPVKNLDRLISAFSRLVKEIKNKSFELWIVGDGPLRETLENQSRELGISDQVIFWGFHEDVFPFLEKADVFVLPSLSEGSSVSLVEAMDSGLPSIVTKIGGAGEILGSSDAGIQVDPNKVEDILQAMKKLYIMPNSIRSKMGKIAKKESSRFYIDQYVKALLNIYKG